MSPTNKNDYYYDYKTRRRVWNSIYKRIEAPVGNPYRFTHISSHLHVRLDDHVKSLLSEELKNALPRNMDPCDYSLPKKVQDGAPNRSPRRSPKTTAGTVIPGTYANDDIIYSPTAQAATRPRAPVSEVYHTLPQGELRRPTKISNSPRQPQDKHKQSTEKPHKPNGSQSPKQPQTPKCSQTLEQPQTPKKPKLSFTKSPRTPENKHTAAKAGHVKKSESSQSNKSTSTKSNDSDRHTSSKNANPHKDHCRLCRLYQSINIRVATARIEHARGVVDSQSADNALLLATQRVEDFQPIMGRMENNVVISNPTYDPADTRLWSQLAKQLAELLDNLAQEEQQDKQDRLDGSRRTTFVPVDQQNFYDEENFITCPICNELPISGDQLSKTSGPRPDPEQAVIDKLTAEERQAYELWWESIIRLIPLFGGSEQQPEDAESPSSSEETKTDQNKQQDEHKDVDDKFAGSFWLYSSDEDEDDDDDDDDDQSNVDLELYENY
ncbi:hypothetical protein F4805DRAFT_438323 [Annulohypoxylon moriforme]|nr:hypothetical protein F4805DRAFT_438323 [Annulohypoxylon moriforme]